LKFPPDFCIALLKSSILCKTFLDSDVTYADSVVEVVPNFEITSYIKLVTYSIPIPFCTIDKMLLLNAVSVL
jgi:hypothetical protein